MSNSPLICYTKISPNRTSPRNHAIDTITIHCMAGQLSVETCGNVFAPTSRQASSNYGIGPDGRIAMYVPESDRSWCSSSSVNDNRAITIEVASDASSPYKCTDAAFESLIKLCVDICQRNGIKKLVWSPNKSDRVNHVNGCNMTCHRDFSAKSCPGDYLYSRHAEIAQRVSAALNVPDEKPSGNTAYVGKGIGEGTALDDMSVRTGAGTTYTKIGVVKKGQKVEVLEVSRDGWYKIVWPGCNEGYAWTSNAMYQYYKFLPKNPRIRKVVNISAYDTLNVRCGAGVTFKKVYQLGLGNQVEECASVKTILGANWKYIRFYTGKGYTCGYVNAVYLG